MKVKRLIVFTPSPPYGGEGWGEGAAYRSHPNPLPQGRRDFRDFFKNFLISCSLLISTSASFNIAHADLPDSMDLTYKASWGGMTIGTLEKKLRKESDNGYIMTAKIKASGLASLLLSDTYDEESHFQFDGDNIFPQSYRLGPLDNPDKQRMATFDWQKKVVKLNNDRSYPLKPGIQDAATFPLYWMIKPPVNEKNGDISIVDGKRMTTFKYTVKGKEKITTLLGEANTLLVERQKEGEPKKVFRMWLDIDRSYLAVRLENVRPNNTMVFELEKVEGL